MGKLGEGLRRMMAYPFRLLLPRSKLVRWLIIAIAILLLLTFLEPAVNLLIKLLELGMRLIEPLLDTMVGRVVLLLLVAVLGGLLTATLLRSRLREFRSRVLLGRHLQGVAALLDSDARRCRERFLYVARRKSVKPVEYPALAQDANIKLARLALEENDVDGALSWLTRVVEPDLPKELGRSLLQLRVQALRRQGAALPETLEQDVRDGLRRFTDDYLLHKELRALVLARDDLDEVAQVQTKIAGIAPTKDVRAEQQTLLEDLMAAGCAKIRAGELDAARKYQKRMKKLGGAAAGLLLGEIYAAAGDARAAVKAFGATRTPEGLDRIAELFSEHPGIMEPRELMECCPMQGTLLVVARELARQGELDQARRAAQHAAEILGPTPTVCAVLVEILQLLGREQEARLLGEQAVQRLLESGGSAAS
ncbi:MAG: hypothetical protein VYE77_11490 [Planctomycetota bacterium]|nr:hypothetical protein [Planctomycetota bacterium]